MTRHGDETEAVESCSQLNEVDRENIQPRDDDDAADDAPAPSKSLRIQGRKSASANMMRSVGLTPITPKAHIDMVTVLANISASHDDPGPDEPNSLKEATASPYWKHSEKAIHVVFRSLIDNETWEYRNAPAKRAVLAGRWVLEIEKDRLGKILKFKARWVACGYKQQEVLDNSDTFASVVKPMS